MTVKYKTTTMTIEPTIIYCSRLMDNRLYKLEVPIDSGSTNDLLTKCVRVAKLSNDMFKELSRIDTDTIV